MVRIRNILLVNERRLRISAGQSSQLLGNIANYPTYIESVTSHESLSDLARTLKLTIYDAAYLELAIRRHLPLATLHKALRAAAGSAGIPLLA